MALAVELTKSSGSSPLEAQSLPKEHAAAAVPPEELKPHQQELWEAYRVAKVVGSFSFPDPTRVRKDLVGGNGQLQMSFLLPSGQGLGETASIGLPYPCKEPRLHDITYSKDDKGYWLRFSALKAKDERGEALVLILEEKEGKEAVKSFAPHQKELLDAYRAAKERGSFTFPNSTKVREDLVGGIGQLKMSFLLPSGQGLGETASIGLPKPCTEPRLHDITYSKDDKGYWLRFSALDAKDERGEALVLILEEKEGKEAVKSFVPQQKELLDAYRAAKERGSFTFPDPTKVREDLVQRGSGRLQMSFLLPSGQGLGEKANIGLPNSCTEPRLHEITYSKDDKGYWLRFSALNTKGERVEALVLILEEKEGKEAVKSFAAYQREPRERELLEAYKAAKERDSFTFPDSTKVREDLVGGDGRLQMSFPLPSGQGLGKPANIGLPKSCTEQRLHEITYSPSEGGYWIRMSALTRAGTPRVVTFLVSEDPQATERGAIRAKRVLGNEDTVDDVDFPEIFRRAPREAPSSRVRCGNTPRGEAREVVQAIAQTANERVTFVKGEAFEQLSGVMLSLLHPSETITPQFCLRVGQHEETGEGFFGMRADFRVGNRLVYEIKWGNHTPNIIDTYQRHTHQLGVLAKGEPDGRAPYEYRLLLLQTNSALSERGIPFALFSDATEELESLSKELVSETQALLASFVHREDRLMLEQLRDYLYTAFVVSQKEQDPTRRTECILSYLSKLHETPDEDLSTVMKRETTKYVSPLEAHFEWEGKVHRGLIDPVAYFQEHPEAYELLYTFDYKFLKDGFRRLAFASKLDRDLSVAHECLHGSEIRDEGSKNEEVLRKPLFKFGKLWVTTHPELANREDTVCITSLLDLTQHLSPTDPHTNLATEDALSFVQEWTGHFGSNC